MKSPFHGFKALLLAAVLLSGGCYKDDCGTPDAGEDAFPLGWDESAEQPDSIQVFLNSFGNLGDCGGLPATVSLLQGFPPVGQQGQFGTCVAWAVGYSAKTAMEARSRGLPASQLSQPANQISPKDLFYAIPDNLKGDPSLGNCHGTQFWHAFDVLQTRGAATMQTAPYSGLGDCSSLNVQSAWENEAAGHKIKYYRRIGQSVCSIKEQLAAGNPVLFGARVGNNFQALQGDFIFSQPPTGEAGGHAMVIAGYDDSRQAFRIVNSWGANWGDQGYAWVDYNFMVSEFVSDDNLYVAVNDDGNVNPPDVNPNADGADLASWAFSDFASPQPLFPTMRTMDFNLYNIGNQPARASDDWSFMYLYYNAYDANDYGILFLDGFNENPWPGQYQANPLTGGVDFNFDIAPGGSFAQTVFGLNSITRTYTVPAINGFYYLLLVADATGTYSERDEFNNLFYTTWQTPKWFFNGQSPLSGGDGAIDERTGASPSGFDFRNDGSPGVVELKQSKFNTTVNERYPNAYQPEEIIGFFKQQRRSGELGRKIQEFKSRQPDFPAVPYRPQ